MATDFYQLLGVERDVDDQALKKAWRKFSMKWHPDMQHDKSEEEKKQAEEMFKKGQAAYECLSDPEKRQIYDQYGEDGLNGHPQGGFHGFNGEMPHGMADFIRNHMRNFGFDFDEDSETARRTEPPDSNMPEDGKSFRIKMDVNLEDIIYGAEKEFTIDGFNVCPDCHGHNSKQFTICPDCNGSGMFQKIEGNTLFQTTCRRCQGSGYVVMPLCHTCNGFGRVKAKRDIKVKIPAGMPDGGQLRIKGGGVPGINGGQDGALFIIINTKNPTGLFKRINPDGFDLAVNLYINPLMGAFGGKTFVITPFGPKDITIPEKTENGKILTLPNLGINKQGTLYVNVVYDMLDIDALDKDEKEYWRMLLDTHNDPSYYLKNFKEQLKKATKK